MERKRYLPISTPLLSLSHISSQEKSLEERSEPGSEADEDYDVDEEYDNDYAENYFDNGEGEDLDDMVGGLGGDEGGGKCPPFTEYLLLIVTMKGIMINCCGENVINELQAFIAKRRGPIFRFCMNDRRHRANGE